LSAHAHLKGEQVFTIVGELMAEDEILTLIKRIRNSDEAAAKRLVELMYPTIIRIVRNHLPKRESEEDLCQDIFLKLFGKLHQFRGDMPFEHWVSRIAVNTCIDHLRKQRIRPELRWSDFTKEQEAMLDNLRETASLPPERSPEEARDLLERLLQSLHPEERAVINWLHLEEKPVAEICDLTGWSASKVKVLAFRGRQKLSTLVKRLEK
jgi:RNA polymerase sigma-70 factor (ECF subfamily)